jgi:hypothetical protein
MCAPKDIQITNSPAITVMVDVVNGHLVSMLVTFSIPIKNSLGSIITYVHTPIY